MPIVSVYGKYAAGVKKRKKGTSDITGIIRQAKILLASGTDDFGNNTIEGYQSANEYLSSFQGDPRISLEMLDNENAALGLVDNLIQAQNSVTLFRAGLEDKLDDIAERSKGDPLSMIYATADLYLEASDLFQENEMPLILSRLSSGQKIPSEVLNFSDELESKAIRIAAAANSFTTPDFTAPDGELGPEFPEAYGFITQTNPATGKVSSMRFEAISSLSPVPAGYFKTDSFNGGTKIPVYIPTIREGNKIIGRLAGRTFISTVEPGESPEEVSTRILKQQDVGELPLFGEFFEFRQKERRREIDFSEFSFDVFDIPRSTVLRDGAGNFSYLDKDNVIHSVESLESLRDIINSTGGDGERAISQAFRVTRNYLNQKSAFEKGDPITVPERITADLGGGSLAAPATGIGTDVLETGSGSRFQPRGPLEDKSVPETTPSGVSGRVGSDFVKVHEESRQKIIGTARRFFERAKESKFLNP